jgi:two-component system LytT family sensor kinase
LPEVTNIESLKQQINPHFFFNSLNTLSGLAREDSKKTVEFIDKLSQVFRYVLDIQEKNMVTIAEEIHFAKAYIYLLKVRFDTKFNVDIRLNSSDEALVPSLCTQLLLENCFKHNSMSSEQPLRITISTENDYLIIKNTMAQMSHVAGNGIGLKNLNERSKLLTGKAIEVSKEHDFFIVKVPTLHKTTP